MNEDEWINSIGGRVGEEFRRSLKSYQGLHQFVNNHPTEATQIALSYRATFQTPQPTLEEILKLYKLELPYMMEKQIARINIKIGGREYLVIIMVLIALVLLTKVL